MTTTKSQWNLDVRVRERNLKAGTISQEDVAKMLGSLPDVADMAQLIDVTQPAVGSEEEPVAAAEGAPEQATNPG